MPRCAWKPRKGANSPNGSSEIGTIATGRQAPADSTYIGRFAPSPTGPLHFGSLVAATASYLQARSHQGRWLLRIEDIDPPRELPGATDDILRVLDGYGFEWDGPVCYQSESRPHHDAAIARLVELGAAYPCGCSRRDLEQEPVTELGPIYPGTCRAGTRARTTALRVRTDNRPTIFTDIVQGEQRCALESESGDFVVLRKDGLVAYQLAVVVDDYLQGVTEVVRGIDLMHSTPRQIWLQQLLDYPTPGYAHIPVATGSDGQKLSKSQGALPVRLEAATTTLFDALDFLGLPPPGSLENAPLDSIWAWATNAWDVHRLQGRTQDSVAENLYQAPNS